MGFDSKNLFNCVSHQNNLKTEETLHVFLRIIRQGGMALFAFESRSQIEACAGGLDAFSGSDFSDAVKRKSEQGCESLLEILPYNHSKSDGKVNKKMKESRYSGFRIRK